MVEHFYDDLAIICPNTVFPKLKDFSAVGGTSGSASAGASEYKYVPVRRLAAEEDEVFAAESQAPLPEPLPADDFML